MGKNRQGGGVFAGKSQKLWREKTRNHLGGREGKGRTYPKRMI